MILTLLSKMATFAGKICYVRTLLKNAKYAAIAYLHRTDMSL